MHSRIFQLCGRENFEVGNLDENYIELSGIHPCADYCVESEHSRDEDIEWLKGGKEFKDFIKKDEIGYHIELDDTFREHLHKVLREEMLTATKNTLAKLEADEEGLRSIEMFSGVDNDIRFYFESVETIVEFESTIKYIEDCKLYFGSILDYHY